MYFIRYANQEELQIEQATGITHIDWHNQIQIV